MSSAARLDVPRWNAAQRMKADNMYARILEAIQTWKLACFPFDEDDETPVEELIEQRGAAIQLADVLARDLVMMLRKGRSGHVA